MRADLELLGVAVALLACAVLFWAAGDRKAMVWTAAVGAWVALAALYWRDEE